MAANENPAYPDKLQTSEEALIKTRPGRENFKRDELVGVGLSGGGIRSATFCLGVFQALGNLGLLKKIDYTSSVSGGGYFASFYGRLFTRHEVIGLDQVAGILAPDDTHPLNAGTDNWMRKTFRWLRENGRYLAPHGAGDLLLDISVVLRNWLSLQVVLATFVLTLLLIAQWIRALVQNRIEPRWPQVGEYYREIYAHLPDQAHFWWSPYIVAPLVIFVFLALPIGWSYWLVAARRGSDRGLVTWLPCLVPLLFIVAMWQWPCVESRFDLRRLSAGVRWVVGVISALILLFALVAWLWAIYKNPQSATLKGDTKKSIDLDKASNWLSSILKNVLTITVALLFFAIIDSFGQQLYANGMRLRWIVLLFGPAPALAPFIKWIASTLADRLGSKSASLPLGLLAGVGAAVIIFPVLVLLDSASYAVAYNFHRPAAPAGLIYQSATGLEIELKPNAGKVPTEYRQSSGNEAGEPRGPIGVRMQLQPLSAMLVAMIVLALIAGRLRGFLNTSTLLSLYSSRLVRAYLGASNPVRLREKHAVSDTVPGDDIAQEDYWSPQDPKKYDAGAPLHLVNVTINETYGGPGEVEQRDRKGVGMAIGPAGISAGVEHHVVFNSGAPIYKEVTIFPPKGADTVRTFDYPNNVYTGQLLHLGSWTGISGAAASTGLGSLTSIGLSLLAGFFNVRLGYWWDSGVRSGRRLKRSSAKIGRRFEILFPVHRQLLNEFLGRFPGTSERYWYLTDGGHFENMGGYELIRRRLPLIVIIDAEADANYTYHGLAGLVQKARLDFGAEIEFLNSEWLDDRLGKHHPMRKHFGTLDQLRRGTWTEEPVDDPATAAKRLTVNPPALDGFSLAHAALAKINYARIGNEPAPSPGWMIVIKPTLTGDEPADVLRYHGDHPAFPHESTADQFFAEAQWESYRKLGEHIGQKLFEYSEAYGPFPTFARPASLWFS